MTIAGVDQTAAQRRRHRHERIAAAAIVAILALMTAGVMMWRSRIDAALQADRRYIPQPAEITPEVLLLQEFVRIDTSTPEGSAEGARWLAAQLEKRGVRPELIESAPGRLNVYARITGRQHGDGLLLFNHIDVVGPGRDAWKYPPFAGKVEVDMLYGRGALDMKGVTIAQLLAFVDLARSGRRPEHDLVFLATADEETGSTWGMQWIIANRPDVLAGIRYGITEGGITEMITADMTYFGIEIGGKQYVDLTVEAPDVESLRRARIALEPAIAPREPHRILPGVRTYMRDIAPTRLSFGDLLANIDRAVREGHFWRLPMPYRDLTQNTLWLFAPQNEEGRATMRVKMANLPDEIPEERIAWLGKQLAPFGGRVAAVHHKQGPVPLSPKETPLFEILSSAARERYATVAGSLILYRSATDSRFLRPLGIICYGVSPFPVSFAQSQSMHAVDERIGIAWFMDGIGYMRDVVEAWSRQE